MAGGELRIEALMVRPLDGPSPFRECELVTCRHIFRIARPDSEQRFCSMQCAKRSEHKDRAIARELIERFLAQPEVEGTRSDIERAAWRVFGRVEYAGTGD